MEMTWQRSPHISASVQNERLACFGEPDHGDERGHDALQRIVVLLDRCIPVHRRLPSSKHSSDCRPREEGVNKRERIFSAGNSQVPGITGKDFLPIRRARKSSPLFRCRYPIRAGRLTSSRRFLAASLAQLGRLDEARQRDSQTAIVGGYENSSSTTAKGGKRTGSFWAAELGKRPFRWPPHFDSKAPSFPPLRPPLQLPES
jgi:hypothetical protein